MTTQRRSRCSSRAISDAAPRGLHSPRRPTRSNQLVSDLSWWFAPHPAWEPGEDWPEVVPVVRYETDGEVALIDPFLPPEGEFDPHGKPVRVLLTQGAHYRGTRDFVERFDASVWAPPRAAWGEVPNPPPHDRLPPVGCAPPRPERGRPGGGRGGHRARRRAATGRVLHPRARDARQRRRP